MTVEGPDSVMTQRELTSEASPLSESAFRPNGTFPVRIIAEGWGASGFYSKRILCDAAGLYAKNTRMFINHPSRSELKERPERDLNQLAAYFINEKAVWDDNGIYGPGLYQEAKALPNYADFLKEAAPVIGVSHFVLGRTRPGEAAGRKGPIVESIDSVLSVDLVTQPGAKGSIGAIYESWINAENPENETHELQLSETREKENMVDIKESGQISPEIVTESRGEWLARIDTLRETEKTNLNLLQENGELKSQITAKDSEINTLKESNAKLQEKIVLSEASAYAAELVDKAEIPELAKTRIKESLVRQATVKDGNLDKDALKTIAESEIEYAKSLSGSTGTVRGMGSSGTPPGITLEESKKALIESLIASGLSKDAAEFAVGSGI